jgi:hypothetical protein
MSERLVSRREAAEILGYSLRSLETLMSRTPARWPKPVSRQKRGRTWVPLYSLRQLQATAGASPDPELLRGMGGATVSDEDGLIVCLECNRRFRSLSGHLRTHGLTSAEYRERHCLPATAALSSDATRLASQSYWRSRLADDPAALDHLTQYHDPARLDEMRERGIEKHHETRDYEVVRENRLPGQRRGVEAMVAARLAKLDAAVREHGYTTVEAAVIATREMSMKAAARATGLSEQTVKRRRVEYGLVGDATEQ